MKRYVPLILLDICALFVIAYTAILGSKGNWITENLSVVGYWYEHETELVIWGWLTGIVFVAYLIYLIHILDAKRLLPFSFTVMAGVLLIAGVYIPYQPEPHPVLSVIHIGCSFLAPVCVVATLVYILIYMTRSDYKNLKMAVVLLIILLFGAAVIFVKCTIITTLLEVYTVSAITLFMTVISILILKK